MAFDIEGFWFETWGRLLSCLFYFFLVARPRRATVIPARVPWLLSFLFLLLLLVDGGGLWFGTFRKIRETPKGGCFRSSTRHPGEVARE